MSEATIGTPVMQKCVGNCNGNNLPWNAWENSNRNGWDFDSSSGGAGPCTNNCGSNGQPYFNGTYYNNWNNNMSSAQNYSNHALYCYKSKSFNGGTLTILPGSYEPDFDNLGWNDTVQSTILDSAPFTCDSFLAHTEPNTSSNFYSSAFQLGDGTSGDSARIKLLQNVYNSDGRTCLDRIRLQNCLKLHPSGALLDPNGTIPTQLLNTGITSGYNYANSTNDAANCNLLINNYCSLGSNMNNSVCQSILGDTSSGFSGESMLSPSLHSYCVGNNLLTPTCTNYCSQNGVNCDTQISSACAAQGTAGVASGSPWEHICACWTPAMSQTACDNLATEYPGANIDCNMALPQCNDPRCSSPLSMKPYAVKQNQGGACPNTLQCIQSITVNNDGTIGNVTISANQDCQQVVSAPPPSIAPVAAPSPGDSVNQNNLPSAPLPSPTSSSRIEKLNNLSKTTKIIMIVVVLIILCLFFLMFSGAIILLS